jgi:cytochrome P450
MDKAGPNGERSEEMTGRTFDIPVDFQQRLDVYPVLDEIRAAAPVHRARLRGEVDVWMVTGYDAVLQALGEPRLSADLAAAEKVTAGVPPAQRRNLLMDSLLATDPPSHTRMRTIVARAFTARRVEAMRPRVQQIVASLLDEIAPDGAADLVESLAFPLPIAVICDLLGVPFAGRDAFRGWSEALAQPPSDSATLARADARRAEMTAYFSEVIRQKRAVPGDDLLSVLCSAHDGELLSDDELLGMSLMLFLSGHETTLCFLANAIVALLTHPDQLAALRGDPASLPTAVDELLRYDGPVARGVARFTTEDVTIAGTLIPKGEMVVVAIAAANRDPARYDQPAVLDIARAENPHVGFGHGIHYCLGAALARLEVTTALGTLFHRFPDLALAVPADELRRRPGPLRGLATLPVTFTPTSR